MHIVYNSKTRFYVPTVIIFQSDLLRSLTGIFYLMKLEVPST